MGEISSIVDVDFVSCSHVEVGSMDGEMRNWEFKRSEMELRNGDVYGIGEGGEFLKRWNRR